MPYTQEQQRETVDLAVEHGTAETVRRTGISGTTVKRWVAPAGNTVQTNTKKTELARQHLAVRRDEKREQLRTLLLDKAIGLLERFDVEHKDYRGKDVQEVYWDRAPSGATKEYAIAVGILIDKFRLEMGEHTGRTEVDLISAESRIDAEIRRLSDDVAAKT